MPTRRVLTSIGSAIFIIPAIAAWHDPALSWKMRAVLGLLGAVAALRPPLALLLIAGLLPLAVPLGLLAGDANVGEQAVVMFLLGSGARLACSRTGPASRLAGPASLLLVVIVSSGLLDVSFMQQRTTWVREYGPILWHYLTRDYFLFTNDFRILHDVLSWCEALLLAIVTERILRRWPASLSATIRMLIVGAGGLATFSATRLAEISLRTGAPLIAAAIYVWMVRFNPFYGDINAAGSLYALLLVPAVWLAWNGWRWAWLPALLLGLALWLAGSRAAIAGAVFGVGIAWIVTTRPSRRVLIIGASAATALVLLATVTSARNVSVGSAATYRVELARAALILTAQHPVFGVGLDKFKTLSSGLLSREAVTRFRQLAEGENAHNNFLQILAELGAAGLTAFLWLLALICTMVWRATGGGAPREAIALGGGLAAFVATCLLGHPLLIEHVRLLFFLVTGLTAGAAVSAAPESTARSGRRAALLATLAVIGVLACLPFRVYEQRRQTNLRGVVYGATSETGSLDDLPYRTAAQQSVWFVSAAAHGLEVSLRASADTVAPCPVDVSLDGRPADTASPVSQSWTRLDFQLPPEGSGATFRRLELRVASARCTLLVGPIVEHR